MEHSVEERVTGRWIQLILIPALYYVGAKMSLVLFEVTPEALVMLWIPNSILLATLFHYKGRRFGYFVGAIILAEIVADYHTFSPTESVLFGAINVLEVSVAYLLMRRWHFHPDFRAPRDIAAFVFAGPLTSAFLSACAAATVYRLFDSAQMSFLEVLRVWWFSDGLGLLILTPLVLSLWPLLPRGVEERNRLRWYDAIAMLAGLVIVFAFSFSHERVFYGVTIRSFLLIPPVLYVVARFSVRTTTAVVAAVAAVILHVTKNGQQPFGDLPIRETVFSAQELIFFISAMSLGMAALLSQLRTDARELENRVNERTAELSAANRQLERLAVTDPLTGIFNRRALFDLLEREIERHRRHKHPLTLIVFDVDHFKAVNDRYGHAVGDTVLQKVAAICSKLIRNSDILARYGGEEFAIIAPETGLPSAVQLAERIRMALRTTEISANDHTLLVTASFGIATLQSGDKEVEELFRRADQALYAAKTAGRDQVVSETQRPDVV